MISLYNILCPYSLLLAFAEQEDEGPMKLDHDLGVVIYTTLLIISHIQFKRINAHYGSILL